jgi:hypothetical protein
MMIQNFFRRVPYLLLKTNHRSSEAQDSTNLRWYSSTGSAIGPVDLCRLFPCYNIEMHKDVNEDIVTHLNLDCGVATLEL